MKRTLIIVVGSVAAVGGLVAVSRAPRPAPPSVETASPAAEAHGAPVFTRTSMAATAPDDETPLRPTGSLADAKRTARRSVRTPEQLARFLDELEARARAQAIVTSFEVEPGIAAIEEVRAREGMAVVRSEVARFIGRMTDLSRAIAAAPVGDRAAVH